jgi:hypothetical protein
VLKRLNVPRALTLYLAWMGLTCGALLAGIGGLLPFGLGAVGPDAAFIALVEAELFFVVVVWPFFMPRLILPQAAAAVKTAGPGAESHLLILQVVVLLVVALPLALVSQNLSEISAMQFLMAQVLVGLAASFVTALLDRPEGSRVRTWYFLGAFVVGALFPFVSFLGGELGGLRLGWLADASPFWAAASFRSESALTGALAVQVAVLGVLTGFLMIWGAVRRPVD